MTSGRLNIPLTRRSGDDGNRSYELGHGVPQSLRHGGITSATYALGEEALSSYFFEKHRIGMRDLAVEVLIHVFTHVVPTSRRHIRLTHVCRLWRTIILDIPEFWADMLAVSDFFTEKDSERAVELWHVFMDRTTSTLPLRLQLNRFTFHLLETIPHYHHRITHLRVQRERHANLPRLIGTLGPLQSLESFIYTGDLVILPLHSASYPRLRHLETGPTSFLSTQCMAGSSLRTLSIHAGYLSPAKFLAALSNCPALEVLRLQQISATRRSDPTGPVRLARLREWYMSAPTRCRSDDHSDEWMQEMLRRIQCPHTAQVTIWSSYDYVCNHFPGVTFPHFIANRRAQLLFILTFNEDLDAPVLSIQVYVSREKTPRFRLSTTDVAWRAGSGHSGGARLVFSFMRTFSHFPVAGITTLQLCLYRRREPVTHAHWRVVLEAFSGLQSLSVRALSCKSLLRALRWYTLPRTLKKLDITCGNGTGIYRNLAITIEVCADEGLYLQHLAFYHRRGCPRFSDELLKRICSVVPEVVIGTL
ncbi:hypothetical protein L226DRAFT_234476 [Lentinus tigrinus ALCF2SS1-7]|uniref:uncharacterized protein n=1 Tax=Lentinus tigrinus ALCF2SS1-7 TaxID=1328758 RepID=UPI001165F3EB|nr:hypothetical protein L226DRAFT_234476 [Lentinus tigrinus ALCF2SS1-7]